MTVVDLSISKKEELANKTDMVGDQIRQEILSYAKDFKRSWLSLGRHLYAVHQDKMYYGWGFEKFEDYVEEEIGIKKSLSLKLLKAYLFLEKDEPSYLAEDFANEKGAHEVPNYEAIDVLRMAKSKKELDVEDYRKLRHDVFEKGKDAAVVRKELGVLIKERKQVDPEEERDKRNLAAITKFMTSLRIFSRDMKTLNLVSPELVDEAESLLEKLEAEI